MEEKKEFCEENKRKIRSNCDAIWFYNQNHMSKNSQLFMETLTYDFLLQLYALAIPTFEELKSWSL